MRERRREAGALGWRKGIKDEGGSSDNLEGKYGEYQRWMTKGV